MSNKLELTWFGKEKEIKPEPRLLLRDGELSYGEKQNPAQESEGTEDNVRENMLIHGDNLLALKALERDFSSQVKCIYIDPPYNTGAAFEHYDDNLEHSIWLGLMRPRLELLRELLRPDGVIFIQIDDNECAYLKVLCDEIFGRKNYVSSVCVKMSTVSGVKTTHREKTILKEKETLLVYCRDREYFRLKPQYVPLTKWDEEYQYYLERNGSQDPEQWEIRRLRDVLEENHLEKDLRSAAFLKFLDENKENIWRRAFIRNEFKELSQENPDRIFVSRGEDKTHYYYRGREMFFLKDKYHDCFTEEGTVHALSNLLADIWTDVNTGKLFNEGKVQFRNSKKPEFLIGRILQMATEEGDLVLDSFLGSGTTAAVAHKMQRRWIGIEMGEHAYTHCKPRLDQIIDGVDPGGLTEAVGWKGGGGYGFYELAPSLINLDLFGEPVINKAYNSQMLAAAVALHEGFRYHPSSEVFWKQAEGNENSYLLVTTSHVTAAYTDAIASSMKEEEYLLIACQSYEEGLDRAYKNIAIKKIPQLLLSRCEFGKENYNLNIFSPPEYSEYEEEICEREEENES